MKRPRTADPYRDLDVIDVAKVIKRSVDEQMAIGIAKELRVRGYLPEDFTMLAYGGNGPLHACGIADQAGIRKILAPPFSSVFSACGAGNMKQLHIHERGVHVVLYNATTRGLYDSYDEFNEIVAVMLNSGWQRWEEYGTNDVTLSDTTSTDLIVNRATEDTWHFAAGLHYRVDPRWLVRGGFAYDTAASTDANRSVDLPLDTQVRFSGGATWEVDDTTALSFGYLFANLGKAPVSRDRPLPGTLIGEYEKHRAHFLSLSLNRTL